MYGVNVVNRSVYQQINFTQSTNTRTCTLHCVYQHSKNM